MYSDKLLQLNSYFRAESYRDERLSYVLDLRTEINDGENKQTSSFSRNTINKLIIALFLITLTSSTTYFVNAQSSKITATVSGWFETKQVSNERVDVTTNMGVCVNGHKFEDCTAKTTKP